VRDLIASMAHYRRMGFATRAYDVGMASARDGFEVHSGVVPDTDRRTSAAYLFVDHAVATRD
jgi:hypothetical protein